MKTSPLAEEKFEWPSIDLEKMKVRLLRKIQIILMCRKVILIHPSRDLIPDLTAPGPVMGFRCGDL